MLAMSPFPDISLRHGRRESSRLRVRLSARIVTLGGDSPAVLVDLSRSGAKLRTTGGAIKVGTDAVLQWGGHEAFGTVVWSRGAEREFSFYDDLTDVIVLETRALDETARLAIDHELARDAARRFCEGTLRL